MASDEHRESASVPRSVVVEHVAAFNARSTPRLLAGFADDAAWMTGQDTARGKRCLADLFDDELWSLNPSLTVGTLIADGGSVAVELREGLDVEGEHRSMNIAAFFEVRSGLIAAAKVYREGSADIE